MGIAVDGNAFAAQQVQSTPASTPANTSFKSNILETPIEDKVELSTKDQKKAEAPKIGMLRVLIHRLKKDQIEEINTNRTLPKNAKIVDDEVTGEPKLTWNLLDWTEGTHTMPAGYELKRDLLGFTHVVREDAKAWWLKK